MGAEIRERLIVMRELAGGQFGEGRQRGMFLTLTLSL
jgi:hypothetical protein